MPARTPRKQITRPISTAGVDERRVKAVEWAEKLMEQKSQLDIESAAKKLLTMSKADLINHLHLLIIENEDRAERILKTAQLMIPPSSKGLLASFP